MKFALFIIAVCIITLHATAVTGQLHGYVYTIAEYAGQVYTGYMKVGHSSEAPVRNQDPDPEAKYINIKRRFTNMKSGNPRHLQKNSSVIVTARTQQRRSRSSYKNQCNMTKTFDL